MIRKYENFSERKYDQSKDDFELNRKHIINLIDKLYEEYEDFTNDVSPECWRTTSHHLMELRSMKRNIQDFIPISIQEKDIEYVKKNRFNGSS